MRIEAEHVIASVVEAHYPLCKVELLIQDDCPCCGDHYTAISNQAGFSTLQTSRTRAPATTSFPTRAGAEHTDDCG